MTAKHRTRRRRTNRLLSAPQTPAYLVPRTSACFGGFSGTTKPIGRVVGVSALSRFQVPSILGEFDDANGLGESQAGVVRAIDTLRDAEQHWFIIVDEGLLYLYARAFVTLFDEILKREFEDDLVNHLPLRVLPVSAKPPVNVELLLDREFAGISELLTPGRRARDEARGRIRTLLAMESHVVDEVEVSEKDINRVERAIRAGKVFEDVFPRLSTIDTEAEGEGLQVKVHFTKKQGAPVRFVSGDDPAQPAAVRELDLQKKFHMGARELSSSLGLSDPKAKALRSRLGIDQDVTCVHTFEFGKTRIPRYSDNAKNRMKAALEQVSIDEVWRNYQEEIRRDR